MGIYPSSLCRSHFGNKLDSKNNPIIDSLQSDFPSPNIQKRGCVHSQKSDRHASHQITSPSITRYISSVIVLSLFASIIRNVI